MYIHDKYGNLPKRDDDKYMHYMHYMHCCSLLHAPCTMRVLCVLLLHELVTLFSRHVHPEFPQDLIEACSCDITLIVRVPLPK